MIKGFRQIAFLTIISRLFGLVRTITFTYFFGASALLDSWFIAFKIPNLSRRLFGEGAASASFIPIYTEQLHKDPRQAKNLADTVVTVLFVVLAGLVVLGWTGMWLYYKFLSTNPETGFILSLTSIMLPYMLMVCVVAILGGILNVHRHFAAPAAAPIVLNIAIIGAVVITGSFLHITQRLQLFATAVAVLLAGLLQLLMQRPALVASQISLRPAWNVNSEAFKKIIFMMGPMILGLTATQINTLFDDIIAWCLSASLEKGEAFLFLGRQIAYPLHRGCVSYLNVSQRLYQMPLGVFGISLATAIFPVMSSEAAKKDFNSFCSTIARGFRYAVFIAIPATAALALIAKPLTAALFEHGRFTAADTNLTAGVLVCYSLGLTGFFVQQIVTRAFYSMHDSKLPAKTALLAVIVNLILNLTLIWSLGIAGLALSTAICSYLQVVILVSALRKKLGPAVLNGLLQAVLKTGLNTFIMAIVIVAVLKFTENLSDIIKLAAAVPAGAIVYWLGAKALKIEMLSIFAGKIR